MKYTCRYSDAIVAVSEHTKKDIGNILKIDVSKVTVSAEGVESFFQPVDAKMLSKAKEKFGLDAPFLFYSGTMSPRKNLLRTLMAFNQIKDRFPHDLVLTGGKSWGNSEPQRYIEDNLKDRVRITGHVSDNDLVSLYSLADAYVYPSLYEGFGLPILEAQACGCPVLTSNATSCPEVAGTGAEIVDPYSVDAIAEGLSKILADEKYRHHLIQEGYKNIKRFSWKKTVETIITQARRCLRA